MRSSTFVSLAFAVAVVLAAGLFTGCGGSETTPPAPQGASLDAAMDSGPLNDATEEASPPGVTSSDAPAEAIDG